MAQWRGVFVVRIWLEPDQIDGRPAMRLRGSLERVGADDRHYFGSLDELMHLLSAMVWGEQAELD